MSKNDERGMATKILQPRSTIAWAVISIVAIALAAVAEGVGVPLLGVAIWVLVAAWHVVAAHPGHRALAALVAGLAVLSVGESVLAPGPASGITPLIVVGLGLLALLLDKPKLDDLRGWALPLLLLLVTAALFVLPTVATSDTGRIAKAVGIAALWCALGLLAWKSRNNDEAVQRFFSFVMAVGVVQVAISLCEAAGASGVRALVAANADGFYEVRSNTILGDWTVRTQGTFGYPIPLAAYLAICLVLAFGCRRIALRGRLALMVLFGIGIVLTGSRSGLVAAGAGVVVILLNRMWTSRGDAASRRTLVAVGVAILVLLVGVGYLLVRAIASNDFSLFHRLSMVTSTVNFLLSAGPLPTTFGVGYGGIERAIASGALGAAEAPVIDNAYLSAFLTSGLAGGIVLVALIVAAFIRARSSLIRGAIVACAVSFFFFDALQWHVVAALFFIVVGFASNAKEPVDANVGAAAAERSGTAAA